MSKKNSKQPPNNKKSVIVIDPNDPDSMQALKETFEPILQAFADKLTNADLAKLKEKRLNTYEACQVLGVSEPTLRKMVRNGEVPYHKSGQRKKFFYKSELIEATRKNDNDTTTS